MTAKKPIRVFISVSHDSDEHDQRMLELANQLRRDGIDAWIDLFEPHPAVGWQQWMREQIQRADFILLACTDAYRGYLEEPLLPDTDPRVAWEGHLLRQLAVETLDGSQAIIPLRFRSDDDDVIPFAFRRYRSYLWPHEYDDLYRQLTAQPEYVPARLGHLREQEQMSCGICEQPQHRAAGHEELLESAPEPPAELHYNDDVSCERRTLLASLLPWLGVCTAAVVVAIVLSSPLGMRVLCYATKAPCLCEPRDDDRSYATSPTEGDESAHEPNRLLAPTHGRSDVAVHDLSPAEPTVECD